MKILCIAQVEDRTNLDAQILKQTVQPDRVVFYVDKNPAKTIDERRKRIAENHKKLEAIVKAYKPDLVWQVEQDIDIPPNTLETLIKHYRNGFKYISGIQVGRHGLYAIGAWKNFTENSFESINHKLEGIQEVEATGFYCLLTEADIWLSGKAEWSGEPYGPDVVWGLSITERKYVDMDLKIGHIIKNGVIRPEHTSTCNVRFCRNNNGWKFRQLD